MMFDLTVYFLLMISPSFCDESSWNRYCISNVANRTIHNLRWTKVAVVHDNINADVLDHIQQLDLMVYEMNVIHDTVFHQIYEQLFPNVNVIVAFENSSLLRAIIDKADNFDIKMNHSTDWSHHSKWLVFSSDKTVVRNGGMKVENLQNIAVFTYNVGQSVCTVESFSFQDKQFKQIDETDSFAKMMLPNMNYGYNRRILRVSAMESPPFVVRNEYDVEDDIPFTGYSIDVLRTIAMHLNLTLKYVEPYDGTWGWVHDGLMGQLFRREIDMVASEMTVHVTRAHHMDYITPFLATDQLVLLYKMPPATEPIFLLTQPFQTSVYLLCVAAALGVTITLLLVELPGTCCTTIHHRRVRYYSEIVIKSSLKQSADVTRLRVPGRIIYTFWLFFVMLISCLYCGSLTATLAASSPLREFQSIEEFLNSDFSVGLSPGSIIEQMLKNSTHSNVQRLYQKIRSTADSGISSSNYDHHIQRVQQGKYAYVTYAYNTERHVKNNCNLTRLFSESMGQDTMTYFVQKNSPFKEDINDVMRLLNSGGILKHLWQKWNNYTMSGDCGGKKKNVVMADLIGGVIMAAAGIGLAALSLVCEALMALYRRN